MKFKGKKVKVIIVDEAEEEYNKLKEITEEEKNKGVNSSEDQTLFRAVKEKIDILKRDPQFGIQIPKNKIPLYYTQKYDATNLWKINLPKAWRMIYTIERDTVTIRSIVLEIFDHKKYEKRFRYRKS